MEDVMELGSAEGVINKGQRASYWIEGSRRVPKHEQPVWKLDILIVAAHVAGPRIAHGLGQRLGILQLLHPHHTPSGSRRLEPFQASL